MINYEKNQSEIWVTGIFKINQKIVL